MLKNVYCIGLITTLLFSAAFCSSSSAGEQWEENEEATVWLSGEDVTTAFLKKLKEKYATRKIVFITFDSCSIDKNVVLTEHFPEIKGVLFDKPQKDSKENHLVLDVFKGINRIIVGNKNSTPLSLTLLESPSEEMRSEIITLRGNILLSNWGFLSKIAKSIHLYDQSMKETLEIPAFETNCEEVHILDLPVSTKVDLRSMSNLKTLRFYSLESFPYNAAYPFLKMTTKQMRNHFKNAEPALNIKSAAISFLDDSHPLDIFTLFPNLTHLSVSLGREVGDFVLPQHQTFLKSLVVQFPRIATASLQRLHPLIFNLLKKSPDLQHFECEAHLMLNSPDHDVYPQVESLAFNRDYMISDEYWCTVVQNALKMFPNLREWKSLGMLEMLSFPSNSKWVRELKNSSVTSLTIRDDSHDYEDLIFWSLADELNKTSITEFTLTTLNMVPTGIYVRIIEECAKLTKITLEEKLCGEPEVQNALAISGFTRGVQSVIDQTNYITFKKPKKFIARPPYSDVVVSCDYTISHF